MAYNNLQKTKGYTVLFAVLVSSLILSVGIGIINITLKEIILSASGRDSQYAFYVADSEAECAQYWESKGFFAIPPVGSDITATSSISCFGTPISVEYVQDPAPDASSATSTFVVNTGTMCGSVDVAKYMGTDGGEKTVIYAYGQSTCDTSSARQVQRGLEIHY